MSILPLVVVFVLLGLVVWLIATQTLAEPFRSICIGIILVLLIAALLQAVGLLSFGPIRID
jgi:hypothetical protein